MMCTSTAAHASRHPRSWPMARTHWHEARKPIRPRREHPPAVGATQRQKTPHATCLDDGTCPCNERRDPAHRGHRAERPSLFACRDFGILMANASPMHLKPWSAILAPQGGFRPPHTGNVSSCFVLEPSIVYWSDIGARRLRCSPPLSEYSDRELEIN